MSGEPPLKLSRYQKDTSLPTGFDEMALSAGCWVDSLCFARSSPRPWETSCFLWEALGRDDRVAWRSDARKRVASAKSSLRLPPLTSSPSSFPSLSPTRPSFFLLLIVGFPLTPSLRLLQSSPHTTFFPLLLIVGFRSGRPMWEEHGSLVLLRDAGCGVCANP